MYSSGPASRRGIVVKPREDRLLLGITLVVSGICLLTSLDTSAKWLALKGVPPTEVIFIRYAVQLVLMLFWLVPIYGTGAFRTANLKLETFRALGLMGATAFNFFAVKYLPLTVTSAIMFSSPILVAVLSIPMLGERVGWRRWIAIFAGFVGVLVIIQPGGTEFHPAMFLSLAMVVCYSLFSIFNRKLAGVDSPIVQQLYSALIPTACILPFVFWDWHWPSDLITGLILFSTGVTGIIGHVMLSVAYRYAEASALAPFIYPQMLFMALSSWLVFNQPPGLTIYVGAPIVIGSGIYIWWREREVAEGRKSQANPSPTNPFRSE